jgi:hypothetical protein
MTVKTQTNDTGDLTQIIASNPCAKCRTLKLASCQCKTMQGCAAEEEAEIEAAELTVQQQAEQRLQEIIEKKARETSAETGIIDNPRQENFDTEAISDLLATNILSIDNDMEVGSLTLRLLYNPGLLSGTAKFALRNYLNTILQELEEFKKQYGIAANCIIYEKDSAGNILSFRINLPTYALYEAFILQLASKNLLPTQNLTAQNRPAHQPGSNRFLPINNPLSTRLIPLARGNNRRELDEEEEKKGFKLPRLLPRNWFQS